MVEEHISPSRSAPTNPIARIHFRPSLKWLAIVMVVLVLSGSVFWIVQVQYDKRKSQQRTRMQFRQIARGFWDYSNEIAIHAFMRSHPLRDFKGMPRGTGHLPFPIQQAATDPSQDRLTRNGEGEPLYSWRVELLPFLEGLPQPWDTTVPWHWDSSQPWHAASQHEVYTHYRFFSYDAPPSSTGTAQTGNEGIPDTNVLAVIGPGTAFGDGKEEPKSLKEIPSGTILVVESRGSGIPWPAPGDLDIRTMPRTINAPDGKGISSRYPGGFYVIFADRQVWRLSDKVPFDALEGFFTIEGAGRHDREKVLGPYALERAADNPRDE